MSIYVHRAAPANAVTVSAPARLHLGFLDPGASLGRAFGSLGLMLEGNGVVLEVRRAERDTIAGSLSDAERTRVTALLATLHTRYSAQPVAVQVHRTIPAHTGLGSGTQLALALGAAFVRLMGIGASSAEIALLNGRGSRSGIGVNGFERGGLLLDGGPAAGLDSVPPLLARLPFPDAWRVLLVNDPARHGLSGDAERQALAALAPFPQQLAARLCHLVLMMILPAAAESDFEPFARGIGDLQRTIGEYFSPAQGGLYTSPRVGRALAAVTAGQCAGIGQSSWGPTGFAILPSARAAEQALADARAASTGSTEGPPLEFSIVKAGNRGAALTSEDWSKPSLAAC